MLEQSSLALAKAKQEKINIFKYNNTLAIKDEDSNHFIWLKVFEEAIEKDNIVPFFMPIKNTKLNKVDKYETLVRIVDQDKIHTPDKFIDIAIASGKYHIITQTIIKKTFEYFKDISDISFSINFALRDIVNPETTQMLFEYLENYQYSSNVIIELLETEEISDFVLLNKFINKVKSYGAKIAIDDFGSGYSNFNYILNLNIDIVKLDSCLVADLYTDQSAVVIVSNVIKAVKELDLQVVAERVTSQEIENILTIHEVDYLQGYHIGEPKPDILTKIDN
jgi:EAL domain-containing protein (putative c-di-GMP-specific phosphodiesterase class I)